MIEPFRADCTTYPDRDTLRKKLVHVFLLCHIGELVPVLLPEHDSVVGLRQWHDAMQAVLEANHTASSVDT